MRKMFLLFTAALLLMSCGEQYKAKGVVKDFLKENVTATSYSAKRFSGIDSTRNVTPEQVVALRKALSKQKGFKSHIAFQDYTKRDVLKFVKMMLKVNDDTLNCTFYLDKDVEHVVAFKAY